MSTNWNNVAKRHWPHRGDVQDVRHSAPGTGAYTGKQLTYLKSIKSGEVAERLNAPVLKTGKEATPSWVQIPPSPPD